MIKNPISKTGQIKYFEVFKIAVVILAFFALFSYIGENTLSYLDQLKLAFVIDTMIEVILIMIVINEIRSLKGLLDSIKIKIISYRIKRVEITVLKHINTVIISFKQPIFIRLNVLRC